jgi:hypothetical protein
MSILFESLVMLFVKFLVFSYRTGALWGVLAWMVVFGAIGTYYEQQQKPLKHWTASDLVNDPESKREIMSCRTHAKVFSQWPGYECTQAKINKILQSRADDANYWSERNRSKKNDAIALIPANFACLFGWIVAATILSGKRRAKRATAPSEQA